MDSSPAIVHASVRALRPLVAGLRGRDVAIEPLLEEAGLDPALLGDPDARVPASLVHTTWRHVEELTGDADFGLHVATGIRPGSFDVLDYVCRNTRSVREGLSLYCHYTPLLHDAVQASVLEEPEALRLHHVLSDGTVLPRQYAEFIIASLVVVMRQASGFDVVPERVYFIHSSPERTTTHRDLFRCPVDFSNPFNGFDLRVVDADRPLLDAQPGLLAVLERHAEHLLETAPRLDSFAQQVRAAMVAQLRAGMINAATVAERIGTSERTMRRRLEADGTSYQSLLNDVRTELAERYMDEEHIAIDEVAILLGFSERRAFIRAFRQWTGQSPTQYRRSRASSPH